MEHETLQRLRQFVLELNSGSPAPIRKHISPQFYAYEPKPGEPTAEETLYDLFVDLKRAIPDLHISLEGLAFDGDLIRGWMTLEGAHTGPLWGAPASGNPLTWRVEIALRLIHDRFALSLENLAMPDLIGVLRQLDLVAERMDQPPPHPVSLPEILLRLAFTGQVADKPCSHLGMIRVTDTDTEVCEQCIALGDVWPGLRMCLVCGFVGCCDTSKNKHMKAHYEKTGHSLFRSIRLQEGWVWCYEDQAFFSKRILER